MKIVIVVFFILFYIFLFSFNTYALSDPLQFANNITCVNSLSPDSEIDDINKLVNTNGDWGWAVVVIRKNEMDVSRWQNVLNQMDEKHIIPIIRIATSLDSNGNWQTPSADDARQWADFLSRLYFPTKNKYIEIYNEVNHADEWGGKADPTQYANELSKTIDALKAKSRDFFVLPAPLDLALNSDTKSLDASVFLDTMQSSVPGIFKKLDGWASHSYPNPNFAASPLKSGRTGIDGYKWELSKINPYLDGKSLPVFITETGWARDDNGMDEKTIADNYQIAFQKVWTDPKIVAVCPFVLNYPNDNYYQFSLVKKAGDGDGKYSDSFKTIEDLKKIKGGPERVDTSSGIDSKVPTLIIKDSDTKINVSIKNTGNHVWDTNDGLKLVITSNGLLVSQGQWADTQIFPGQLASYSFNIKGDTVGSYSLNIALVDNGINLTEKEYRTESLTYMALILKSIKKISMGNIFYSSAKLMSL